MNTVLSLAGAMIFTLLGAMVLSPSEEVAQRQAHQLLQQARADVAPLSVRHASLNQAGTQKSDVNMQVWQDQRHDRFAF